MGRHVSTLSCYPGFQSGRLLQPLSGEGQPKGQTCVCCLGELLIYMGDQPVLFIWKSNVFDFSVALLDPLRCSPGWPASELTIGWLEGSPVALPGWIHQRADRSGQG